MKEKASNTQKLWNDFNTEIKYYYSNCDSIYDTPNREIEYESIGSLLFDFTRLMVADATGGKVGGEYDEAEMKATVKGIFDIVGKTMEDTARRVGDDTTIKVLAEVREWVKNPA